MGHGTIEVAKTVLEVADAAFTAVECWDHHHPQHEQPQNETSTDTTPSDKELEALRSENRRLKNLLEQNLKLLQNISESPCLLEDCPPDLHSRLMDTVESSKFLNQLKYLRQNSDDGTGCKFSLKESPGTDLQPAEILVNVGFEDPSWWIWVNDEIIPSNAEERSGIDDENYVVISKEQVLDGVANFMARCILLNPKAKSLTPEEMQKNPNGASIVDSKSTSLHTTVKQSSVSDGSTFQALTKAFEGMNKLETMLNIWHAGTLFYAMSTWALALAGLYNCRTVVRLAALGMHHTSKVVLKTI